MILLAVASCHTMTQWSELRAGKLPMARVYDEIERIASGDGFRPDIAECDRGLGTWQSAWRYRMRADGHPSRSRLRAEILGAADGSEGWTIRWNIRRQAVLDLRRAGRPGEDDWSADGQDFEREQIFGARLRGRLASLAGPEAAANSR
ncbi:MAG: hypothetical protein Fur0037_11970 [Planctomycetota bacterium]